jgi:hypothetical protein
MITRLNFIIFLNLVKQPFFLVEDENRNIRRKHLFQ